MSDQSLEKALELVETLTPKFLELVESTSKNGLERVLKFVALFPSTKISGKLASQDELELFNLTKDLQIAINRLLEYKQEVEAQQKEEKQNG